MKRLYERLKLEFLSPTWNYNVSLIGHCKLLLPDERAKVWIFKSHGKNYFLALEDGSDMKLISENALKEKIDDAVHGIYELCDIRANRVDESSRWNAHSYEFFNEYKRDIEREEYEVFDNIAIISPENVSHITELTGVIIYNKSDLRQVEKTEFINVF